MRNLYARLTVLASWSFFQVLSDNYSPDNAICDWIMTDILANDAMGIIKFPMLGVIIVIRAKANKTRVIDIDTFCLVSPKETAASTRRAPRLLSKNRYKFLNIMSETRYNCVAKFLE